MFELVLRAPQDLVEAVSDALMDELDALSVSVEDADAGTDGERALFGEPGMPAPAAGWQRSTLKALFETETAAEGAAALLLAKHTGAGLGLQSLDALAPQDWVRLTQQQFAPVSITPTFWVVPTWHEPPPEARQVLRLDPGLAFGTGTHPTTRMCLRWLAQTPASARLTRVLDYGCGSGILAIGAALMGAQELHAVDIDPAAVQATRDNAAANGVTLQARLPDVSLAAPGITAGTVPGAAPGTESDTPDHSPGGSYTVVLANILAMPLKLLAPLLTAQVAPGGWLVLAGILQRQADELKAAYAPGVDLQVSDSEDGWILMTARKPV